MRFEVLLARVSYSTGDVVLELLKGERGPQK